MKTAPLRRIFDAVSLLGGIQQCYNLPLIPPSPPPPFSFCTRRYTPYANVCLPCPHSATTSVIFTAVLLLIGSVVFFSTAASSLTTGRGRCATSYSSAWLKVLPVARIFFDYLQTTGLLMLLTGTSFYRLVMGWTAFIAGNPLDMSILRCVSSKDTSLSYSAQFLMAMLLPLTIGFFSFCVVAVTSCAPPPPPPKNPAPPPQAARRGAAAARCLSVATALLHRPAGVAANALLLLHTPLTLLSLRAVVCTDPINGVRYLSSHLDVVCGSPEQAPVASFARAFLVLLSFGTPLALFVGVLARPRLLDTEGGCAAICFVAGYRGVKATPSAAADEDAAADVVGPEAAEGVPTSHGVGTGISGVKQGDKDLAAEEGNDAKTATSPPTAVGACSLWCDVWCKRLRAEPTWWGPLVVLRKAMLAVFVVAVPNRFDQLLGTNLTLMTSFFAQLFLWPLESDAHNFIDAFSLAASLLQALSSLALLEVPDSPDQRTLPFAQLTKAQAYVSVAAIALNVVVLSSTFLVAALPFCCCCCNALTASARAAKSAALPLKTKLSTRHLAFGAATGAALITATVKRKGKLTSTPVGLNDPE